MQARPGVTFIEVALAVALLASLAGVITTAYDSIGRLAAREQDSLDATEVAHRLILNYLLDPKSLPKEGERIPYGDNTFFRHKLIEEMLIEQDSDEENVAIRKATLERDATQNQRFGAGLKRITVKIYHLPNSGYANVNKPLASLTRVYSPVDPSKDEDIFLRQVEQLMGQRIEVPSSNNAPGGPR